jgi:hypothetical protein
MDHTPVPNRPYPSFGTGEIALPLPESNEEETSKKHSQIVAVNFTAPFEKLLPDYREAHPKLPVLQCQEVFRPYRNRE